MMKKKKGFTLVELLAVIVVLAIILVIAVPKILDVIKSSRENSLISSIKLIARNAEQKLLTNEVLGEDEEFDCSEVADLSENDYQRCIINFDVEGNATVSITGKGKFSGYTCSGTKNNVTCGDAEPLVCSEYEVLSLDGECVEPVHLSRERLFEYFSSDAEYYYLTYLKFYSNGVEPEITDEFSVFIEAIDVSEEQNGSIIAYVYRNSWLAGTTHYVAHIVGNSIISLPEDSSNLFNYYMVTPGEIYFNHAVSTTGVTNMSSMFGDSNFDYFDELDLTGWDFTSVIDMHYMFFRVTEIDNLILDNIKVGPNTNADYAFCNSIGIEDADFSAFENAGIDTSKMFICPGR